MIRIGRIVDAGVTGLRVGHAGDRGGREQNCCKTGQALTHVVPPCSFRGNLQEAGGSVQLLARCELHAINTRVLTTSKTLASSYPQELRLKSRTSALG